MVFSRLHLGLNLCRLQGFVKPGPGFGTRRNQTAFCVWACLYLNSCVRLWSREDCALAVTARPAGLPLPPNLCTMARTVQVIHARNSSSTLTGSFSRRSEEILVGPALSCPWTKWSPPSLGIDNSSTRQNIWISSFVALEVDRVQLFKL